MEDEEIVEIFSCFQFTQDPIFNGKKRSLEEESYIKILIWCILLPAIMGVIIEARNGEYINLNKYNVSSAYFMDDKDIFEKIDETSLMNKVEKKIYCTQR